MNTPAAAVEPAKSSIAEDIRTVAGGRVNLRPLARRPLICCLKCRAVVSKLDKHYRKVHPLVDTVS